MVLITTRISGDKCLFDGGIVQRCSLIITGVGSREPKVGSEGRNVLAESLIFRLKGIPMLQGRGRGDPGLAYVEVSHTTTG